MISLDDHLTQSREVPQIINEQSKSLQAKQLNIDEPFQLMLSCLYLYLYERLHSRVVTLLARRRKAPP
jgi:hypothetical protein